MKYGEISRKIGKNTDKYRHIGDISENYREKYRRNFSIFQTLLENHSQRNNYGLLQFCPLVLDLIN